MLVLKSKYNRLLVRVGEAERLAYQRAMAILSVETDNSILRSELHRLKLENTQLKQQLKTNLKTNPHNL
jgi:hypothetical protein